MIRTLVAACLCLALVRTAGAQALPLIADEGDPDVEERLRFLEERIALEARGARTWESLWSIVDIGAAGFGVYQLSQHQSNAQVASGHVGITKAATGLVFLTVLPLNATRGARALVARGNQDIDRLGRLALAERVLYRNAIDAETRYTWRPHVIGAIINLAGGLIIGALGDWKAGARSAGVGLAITELQIWTQPWRARRDLREYRSRFGDVLPPEPPPKASLKAGATGLSVTF